jgi:hypothetical protein
MKNILRLLKLTGTHFIGRFHQHVYAQRKKQSSYECLFALLGSAGVNAAHKYVGEIDPRHGMLYKNGKARTTADHVKI